MAAYTKEFLVDAYVHRFMFNKHITVDQLCELEQNANKFYDEVGRDKFRVYASLDADALKQYKNAQ